MSLRPSNVQLDIIHVITSSKEVIEAWTLNSEDDTRVYYDLIISYQYYLVILPSPIS